MMRVKDKNSNEIFEAKKREDGTYEVNGKEYSREEMSKLYIPIKEKKEVVTISTEPSRVEVIGDTINELFDAIAKASGSMKNLNKGKEAFNYKYITLGQVIDMTRKPLADNGLAIMNFPSTYTVNEQLFARVEMIVSHKSGSSIRTTFDAPVTENKKQALVQSISTIHSYIVRYHRVNLLGIAGEDDTDGR